MGSRNNWAMRFRYGCLLVPIMLLSGISPVRATVPQTINFDYCVTAESTNCIESLGIFDEQGSEFQGIHTVNKYAEFNFEGLTFDSGDGRAQIGMSWRPDGAPLCWWGSCDYHSGSIDLGIYPTSSLARRVAGAIEFPGENPRQCGSKEAPTLCGKWFNFGSTYSFVFRFRALGFQIGMISGKARDVTFKDLNPSASIETSHTYEVRATNIISDAYIINEIRDSQPRDRTKADFYSDGLVLWFWDKDNSATSRLPDRCSAKVISGPPTQLLFNTFNMGSPNWNPFDSTLSVQLESSHLAFDGTPNKGFYEMVFSKATSECLWGINPEKSARAEVKISYQDGGLADVATVNQGFKDGMLRISASNFHLSTPVISTKLVMESPSVAAPSKTSIVCVKKTIIKRVVGIKPICPTGYKKK